MVLRFIPFEPDMDNANAGIVNRNIHSENIRRKIEARFRHRLLKNVLRNEK